MTQLTMELRARTSDPDTSHDAARSMEDVAIRQREFIVGVLEMRGPCNAGELDEAMGWPAGTAGRRLYEIPNVYRMDKTRPSPSGRASHVYGLSGAA